MKILMTGGTGLVGKSLGLELARRGSEITVVSRNALKAQRELPFPAQVIEGDLSKRSISALSRGSWDMVLHLMGENVGEGRWSSARKQRIINSRLLATRNLIQSLRPGSYSRFIGASAVGYYGDRGEEELSEISHPGSGFLPDLCRDWEELSLQSPGHQSGQVRAAVLRTGFILDSQEGGLPKLISLFQKGLGSPVGSGEQWMAWVHLRDVVRGYLHLIDHPELQGPFNMVSPQPARNREFSQVMAEVLGTFLVPRVPGLVLKAVLGEMSQVILASQKVRPQALLQSGFKFEFPELDRALFSVLGALSDGHRLFEVRQFVPKSIGEVFPFFAEAKNLERITPPSLKFHIEKTSTPEIEAGTLIDYKLRIRGIPVRWQTEIETWSPPHSFSDHQVRGPYSRWHHVHQFETLGNGTLMTDSVTYKLPLGFWGRLGGASFVESDVRNIFEYRRKIIQETFK